MDVGPSPWPYSQSTAEKQPSNRQTALYTSSCQQDNNQMQKNDSKPQTQKPKNPNSEPIKIGPAPTLAAGEPTGGSSAWDAGPMGLACT